MESKVRTVKFKKSFRNKHKVDVFKKRMLIWDSPVEYVNNMYGCHPNEIKKEYFDKIYERKGA